MKKLESLGKRLSKEDQKKLFGGVSEDPPKCGDTGCKPFSTTCPTSCPCSMEKGIYGCRTV